MHRTVRLLIVGTALAVAAGCASDGAGAGGTDPPVTTVAPTPPSTSTVPQLPANTEVLVGQWVVLFGVEPTTATSSTGGEAIVLFDDLGGQLAVSIAQGECFVDGGLASVDGAVVVMTRLGEQTPSECDPGPLTDEVRAFVRCVEDGCRFEAVDGNTLSLPSASPPLRLLRTTATF